MKVKDLIEELHKEDPDEEITIATKGQLLPNAYYNVEVGIGPEGRPVLCPTTLAAFGV